MRSRSTRRQLEQVVGRRPEQVLAEDLAPPRPRRSRRGSTARARARARCRTCAAPSVATVTTTSSGPEAVVLRDLDRAEHVADAREAERGQARRRRPSGDAAALGEVAAPDVGVEQHAEPVGGAVGDRERDVGVQDVVDQRDVLVADPLDVVLAEAVAEHRRALERLARRRSASRAAPSGSRRRRSCRPSRSPRRTRAAAARAPARAAPRTPARARRPVAR